MSSNVIDFGDNVSKTKREYSKGGCRECKRRKIKCDEGKPGCWQCVRLKKDCAYPYAGEKVARVSRKFLLYKGSNKDENEPESETSPSDPESRSSDLADGPGNVVKTGKKRKSPEISRGSVNNQPMAAYAAGEASNGNQNKQGALMNTTQGILKHSNRSNSTSTLIQTNQNLLSGNPKNNSKGSIRHVNDNPGHTNGKSGHANGSISQPNALANQPNTLSSQPNSNTSIHNAGLSHPDSNGNSTTNNMSAAFTFKRPNGYDVLTQIQSSQMNQLNQMSNQTLPSHVSTVPTDRFGVSPSGLSPGIPGIPNLSPSYMSPGIPSISSSYISPRFNHSSIESLLNNDNDHGIPDDQLFQLFNMDDLNLLASDLNNIVSNIMHESNFKFAAADEDDRSSAAAHGSSTQSTPYGAAPSPQPDTDKIPRNIPFEYIKVTKTHEKLYLEEFYNDFAGIILPFSSYDPATCCYFNPARDIILKCASTEAFLLAAVLAHGAKASFKKNSLKEDEEAYCKYLSKCLTLLGPALNNQNNLTSNIEAVLLTVLLLTAANAANPKQDWRAHLKGAKDLLLKISSRKMKSSKILIFCKFWFVSFEVLAGVSSRMGGTLKTEEEIENLITPGDEYEVQVLTDLGILVDSGFSILGGYHNDSVVHLKDLILILHRVRHNKDYQPKNPFEYLRLLSEFYKLTEIVFINSKCVLSEADFPDGKVPHGLLLDTLLINDEKVIISWMDTSHQAYVLASLITLLTVCFKETYESPQVQMLTNRVTSLVSFLSKTTEAPRQTIKCSMMMIQWPMLIAGMQCTREDGKYVLMKFFRISAQIGSGSAGFALRRVTNIWNYRERGLKVDYGFGDDTNDILSY